LISVDLKGAKKMGAGLYSEEDIENQLVYNTPPLKINRSKHEKNNYQKDLELLEEDELDVEETPKTYSDHLTETTKLWSDYSGCYYHPLTWNEIDAYTHDSTTAQFADFSQGVDVFESQDYGFDLMEEKVRKFMEECDSPQGFQVLADADDAFSGFTHSLLQEIRQEYAKKTVMVYSLSKSTRNQSVTGKVNQALLLNSVEEEGVIYVPIKLPSQADLNADSWSKYLSPQFETMYQQSGYVAAAIDNISLPFRY
jgi:Tubulin domain